MNQSNRDSQLWRAAVDEAGHVIEGRILGITIRSAVIDFSDVCETNVDWDTVRTVEVAAKFRLAGLAALMVMGCFVPEDADQPDFVTTKQYLAEKLAELGLSDQDAAWKAEIDTQHWLQEVHATLSEPTTKHALLTCARYIFQYRGLEGHDVNEVIDGFFNTARD